MSELLQSGQHPGADQLNAFAEHALPPHERAQTLAHLADCADCRTIVSLSLPPVEDSQAALPIAARRPWFSSWNLAWPVAAGLAALIFFVVHTRSGGHVITSPTPPMLVADSQPPAPPSAQVKPASPVASPPVPRRVTPAPLAVPQPPALALGGGENQTYIENQTFSNLPVQGASATAGPARQNAPPLQQQPGGPGSRVFAGGGLAQQQIAAAPVAVSQSSQLGPASGAADASPAARQAASAPPPPPMPMASAETVTVSDQATIELASDVSSAVISAKNVVALDSLGSIALQHPLPSKLPALSMVEAPARMIAVDAGNAVFFSKDEGRHWTAVARRWQGRAIRVELAGSPAPPVTASAAVGRLPSGNSSLTGTVTDPSGAVITGVTVRIANAAGSAADDVTTDSAGHYRVDRLAPGTYRIEASAPGFTTRQRDVTVGTELALADLTLTVGQATETVTVDSSPIVGGGAPLKAQSKAAAPAPPLFEIITDTGENWVSADGKTWSQK